MCFAPAAGAAAGGACGGPAGCPASSRGRVPAGVGAVRNRSGRGGAAAAAPGISGRASAAGSGAGARGARAAFSAERAAAESRGSSARGRRGRQRFGPPFPRRRRRGRHGLGVRPVQLAGQRVESLDGLPGPPFLVVDRLDRLVPFSDRGGAVRRPVRPVGDDGSAVDRRRAVQREGGVVVAPRLGRLPLLVEAPRIDLVVDSRAAQGLRPEPRPRRARVRHPLLRHRCPCLPRAAGLRVPPLRRGPPEPRLGASRDAVVDALGEDQVEVRIVLGGVLRVPALVQGEAVGQVRAAHLLRERPRQFDLLVPVEGVRERGGDGPEKPAVRPLEVVGGLPVRPGVVGGPLGHVAALGEDQVVAPPAPPVLALAGDVVVLRGPALARLPAADPALEVTEHPSRRSSVRPGFPHGHFACKMRSCAFMSLIR